MNLFRDCALTYQYPPLNARAVNAHHLVCRQKLMASHIVKFDNP